MDWEELLKQPQILLVALVVLVGVISSVSRAIREGIKKIGPTDASPLPGVRGPAPPPARAPVEDAADPEDMLPEWLRPGVWKEATREPAAPAPPPNRPIRPARPVAAPPAARHVAFARPRLEPGDGESAVHTPLSGAPPPAIPAARARTPSSRRAPAGARARLGLAPSAGGRAALRRALLWSEVLGPPRAKRPFRLGGGRPG